MAKIDEYRLTEGKPLLLPLYLAGHYKAVESELKKYDNVFFRKIPRSTLLEEMCQPLADACGFENIDRYHEAERLFMQDQNLYHLHHKPALDEEFIKYLKSERRKEGANQFTNNDFEKVDTKQIIPEEIRKSLEPIGSTAGEYRLTMAVQKIRSFEFVDSLSVPGQIITLKYTPTGSYKVLWSAEYSYSGKTLQISDINLWIWLHQLDINRKIREIKEGGNEPAALTQGT